MEARIVRGTPPTTLQGLPLWQLETRPSPKSDWSKVYGQGHTSTSVEELRASARAAGLKLLAVQDGRWTDPP